MLMTVGDLKLLHIKGRQSAMKSVFQTASHWGTYKVDVQDGKVTSIRHFEADPMPNDIAQGMIDAVDSPARVRVPLIRKSYLEAGRPAHKTRRGTDPYVPVSWDVALDLTESAIRRTIGEHGNRSIFGGSYGWASAGRFHHSLSQLHRFLNCLGGYVSSKTTYSNAAASVILPHVIMNMYRVFEEQPTIEDIVEEGELVVAFGGLRSDTAKIGSGGVGRHLFKPGLKSASDAGVSFVNFSPNRSDIDQDIGAEWMPLIPNTDVAVMLGLAHTLLENDLHDEAFVKKYTVGFEELRSYLFGEKDGVPKDAAWASAISGVPAFGIRDLAFRMAKSRTLVTCALGLQRAEHGEQPIWMTVVLAALLGSIGKPGSGFAIAMGADSGIGVRGHSIKWPALPQGDNPVEDFIPVARIADMLLNPGKPYKFDGKCYVYPDIKLVYWAGGNPFHHHQDLNRLAEAFSRPDTIIVNEVWSTATTRFADIVLPATSPWERSDIAFRRVDRTLVRMQQVMEPVGESRDDYWIFRQLASRLGIEMAFTENRSADEWIRKMWNEAQEAAAEAGFNVPDFETFDEAGTFDLPPPAKTQSAFQMFREAPNDYPLTTPSGKIEMFSKTVASFELHDCFGHPAWIEPREWLGDKLSDRFSLHLLSNQPLDKLHSQLDMGQISRKKKVNGREPILINRTDAEARGIGEGDLVEVFNERGSCVAGAQITDDLRQGVCVISTGAWFDPAPQLTGPARCRNGNPNILTRDVGCSELSQGPGPMSCLVEVRKLDDDPGRVCAYDALAESVAHDHKGGS